MKAARNFTWGPEDGEGEADRRSFKAGEDIPDKIAKKLPDNLILEKVAKSDPNSLSREQLLIMAGVKSADGDGETEEVTVEELQEALGEFTTKAELAEWAMENFEIELDTDDTREQMEEAFIGAYFEEEEEEED